jgi:hypothetical protein
MGKLIQQFRKRKQQMIRKLKEETWEELKTFAMDWHAVPVYMTVSLFPHSKKTEEPLL